MTGSAERMERLAAALPMLRALAEGKRAARDGHKATACPYRPDGPTAVERAQARMWLRGYDRINPLNIDYGD